MKKARLSKAETRILEQCWKLGSCSVREILESLPEDEQVAYTTVQTIVHRLEDKQPLRFQDPLADAGLPGLVKNPLVQGVLIDDQHAFRSL